MTWSGHVVVIGGGFSGSAFALQILENTVAPISVTIVEPNETLGAGLAYSTNDPDHRLNAPAAIHFAVPEGLDAFERRFVDANGLEVDPDAAAPVSGLFPRRNVFAAHIAKLLRPHLATDNSATGICHRPARAIDLHEQPDSIHITLDTGEVIAADVAVLATGNRPAPAPPPFSGTLQNHPAFIPAPWNLGRLQAIPRDARVLILGTALTTADVIATLVKQGHRTPINAVSRRGLRPKGRKAPTADPPPQLWPRIFGPIPEFLSPEQRRETVLAVLRALRRRCREVETAGGTWHDPFDDLRDSVWQIWPSFSIEDKRRFMRHLRPWYDIHRFRMPPQTEQIVAEAEADGLVSFRAAHAVSATADEMYLTVGLRDRGQDDVRTENYGAVINCTGTIAGPGDDPMSRAIESSGLMRAHPSGIGWDVDKDCRAIRRDGKTNRRLFVIGPPSAGVFGDPIGSPYIVAQIWRMLPAVYAKLDDET